MTTTQSQQPSPSSAPNNGTVTELKPFDVLFGRGLGPDQFAGNRYLRDVVDGRKNEYTSTNDYIPKAIIAKDIFRHIQSKGGRFLKLSGSCSGTIKPFNAIADGGEWEVVADDVALEKIKQCLRENREKQSSSNKGKNKRKTLQTKCDEGALAQSNSENVAAMPVPTPVAEPRSGPLVYTQDPQQVPRPPVMNPVLPPSTLLRSNMLGSAAPIDLRQPLLARHHAPSTPISAWIGQLLALQQAMSQVQPTTAIDRNPTINIQHESTARVLPGVDERWALPQEFGRESQLRRLAESMSFSQVPIQNSSQMVMLNSATIVAPTKANVTMHAPTIVDSESEAEDDVVNALAALAVANEPRFTDAQVALERATMTDEEKASILADMFGKCCSINGDYRLNKRPKQDLDKASIGFLVGCMRKEMEMIPAKEKQAMMEAQEGCDDVNEEFSDERLTKFLRCEGMNVVLAARRFINYWEARREVFGPEKYLLRMSLSGAFRDDLDSLEASTYCVLPHADLSGRPLLYSIPHSRAGKGLTTQSLVRVMWYASEAISHQNNDIRSGYVHIVWMKDATVFDFNLPAYKRLAYFTRSCLPIMIVANHVCCPSRSVMRIIKPIMFAIMKKNPRSRTHVHDVSESDVVKSLSKYGIKIDRIPAEMGGSVQITQSAWLENRRAVELMEII